MTGQCGVSHVDSSNMVYIDLQLYAYVLFPPSCLKGTSGDPFKSTTSSSSCCPFYGTLF